MAVPKYQLYCIGGGIKTATTQGTAAQLSATSVPCAGVMISLISTVTGMIAIGNSTAFASGGATGNGANVASTPLMFPCRDLTEVWLSCSVSATTEACRYNYFSASEP